MEDVPDRRTWLRELRRGACMRPRFCAWQPHAHERAFSGHRIDRDSVVEQLVSPLAAVAWMVQSNPDNVLQGEMKKVSR